MAINVKKVSVEAHNSISKVEWYHASLRQAYYIIREELSELLSELSLSLVVKAINNIASSNNLIPTLLVFEAYSRMSELSTLSSSIIKRAEAVRKAMKKLRELQAKRHIRDTLLIRNDSDISATLRLASNDDVIVWREKKN